MLVNPQRCGIPREAPHPRAWKAPLIPLLKGDQIFWSDDRNGGEEQGPRSKRSAPTDTWSILFIFCKREDGIQLLPNVFELGSFQSQLSQPFENTYTLEIG